MSSYARSKSFLEELLKLLQWLLSERAPVVEAKRHSGFLGCNLSVLRGERPRLYPAPAPPCLLPVLSPGVLVQGRRLNLARNPSGRIMNQIPNYFWKVNKPRTEHQKIPFSSFWEVGFVPHVYEDKSMCWALKMWPCTPSSCCHFFKEINKHHDLKLHTKNNG